jgi:hypothetical protein
MQRDDAIRPATWNGCNRCWPTYTTVSQNLVEGIFHGKILPKSQIMPADCAVFMQRAFMAE